MPTRKKTAKRLRKKRTETVIIIQSTIDPKDTLFPEKIARGKKLLSNTNFNGLI
ncbi:hypothetical protein [Puia dinghuensis]|uniref:hypothetical protein n=1 Tax=Puia dinghuensis TaxID=1792502 RepID=UPI00166A0347|nr:hypothetical protein [Puia dinghuensis]